VSRFCPAPEVAVSRLKKDPLRPLQAEERSNLERVSRALGLPAALVGRAKVLLAVANGSSYTAAAQLAGRRTGDAVAALVSRFNRQGLTALEPRHSGGPAVLYDAAAKERFLTEFPRPPVTTRIDQPSPGVAAIGLRSAKTDSKRRSFGIWASCRAEVRESPRVLRSFRWPANYWRTVSEARNLEWMLKTIPIVAPGPTGNAEFIGLGIQAARAFQA
jgi:Helix-turn-helix domain